MWTVDEARAERVNGFSCVYRTPAHLELGVAGAVPCGPPAGGSEATHTALSPAAARTRVVGGLPEFGDYDFEVVADVDPGEVIEWPMRALRVRVEVTPEFAGPSGLDRAVTGTGPLVTGCGPDGGPGDASAGRPWQLDQIVSAAHLTHYPGRGWSAGGDPAAAPEWPDPLSLGTLFDEAGLDGQALEDPAADLASTVAVLADDRALDPLGRASAGTKALLRPGVSGSAGAGGADGSTGASDGADYGWELRLHTSYPFGADYVYEPGHAVPGWDDAGHPVAWPQLWNLVDCPPPRHPGATHDVALALSDDAAGRRLEHSGYGWWVVAPVGALPERIVATKGGLSYGDPAPAPLVRPAAPTTTFTGRASGHLFFGLQRYALAGDLTLTLEPAGDGDTDTTRLTGRIDNVVFVALDHDGLQPLPGPPVQWRSLTLDIGDAGDAGIFAGDASGDDSGASAGNASAGNASSGGDGALVAGGGVWSGAVRVDGNRSLTDPSGLPPADAFTGDWRAEAYGPLAQEIAGRLRIWTPLPEGADPAQGWPAQALLVAGFGGRTP